MQSYKICFTWLSISSFWRFCEKKCTFIAKLSGLLCFGRKRTKRKKRKSQRILKLSHLRTKVLAKLFKVYKLNPTSYLKKMSNRVVCPSHPDANLIEDYHAGK